MAKRYIGINLDDKQLSYAALTLEQGNLRLSATACQELSSHEQFGPALHELLGDEPAFNDRLAVALPASQALTRTLDFPFADAKKIAAALPFELGAQLPIELDDHEVAGLPAQEHADGHRVTAAAISGEVLTEALTPYDDAGLPLHIVDLEPFASAAGLSLEEESLLIVIRSAEITIASVSDGRVTAQRMHKGTQQLAADQLAELITRECYLLSGGNQLPMIIIGTACDTLLAPLSKRWSDVRLADPLPEVTIEPALLPAVTMALRAYREKSPAGFNFRRGRFALRGEWQNLKRRMIGIATLTLLTILCFSVTAWLGHDRRATQAARLQQGMMAKYRALFPEAQAVVDVPLQLSAKIDELRNHPLLAIDQDAASPLRTLKEISERSPKELMITLRDMEFESGTTRIEGRTTSFDAINRFAAGLGQSPLFSDTRIDDAKMSADGQQVDFRLILTGTEAVQ